MNKVKPNLPKMTPAQAKMFWNALTPQQKHDFNLMYGRMLKGDLKLKEVLINKEEVIQTVTLEDKDKPSTPMKPFMPHFQAEKKG